MKLEAKSRLQASEMYKFRMLIYLTGKDLTFKTCTVNATSDREAKIKARKVMADKGITSIRSIHVETSTPIKGPK